MIIQSLGFVEVRGAANAILIADAMVKSSNVRIISETRLDPGQVTVIVEGDIGACMAAVEVGTNLAKLNNCYISSLIKGKPDNAVEGLFNKANVSSGKPNLDHNKPAKVNAEPKASKKSSLAVKKAAQKRKTRAKRIKLHDLVEFMESQENMATTVAQVADRFNVGIREARSKLQLLIGQGRAKRYNRGIMLISGDANNPE